MNQKQPQNSRPVLSASMLMGDKVRSISGENLGKIEELIVDLQEGRVAYAVVSLGGFLGDKLFAIPWKALKFVQDKKEMILNLHKERLQQAPSFNKFDWPDFSDATVTNGIDSYYGLEKPLGNIKDYTSTRTNLKSIPGGRKKTEKQRNENDLSTDVSSAV